MMALITVLFLQSLASARDLYSEFEFAKFSVGGKTVTAFIADTDEKRADGLMYIERLDKDEGMLFVFEQEHRLGFWMKNTVIPLSIGFFNAKGELIDVQEMSVPPLMEANPRSYQSRGPALYALEMNTGWFAKNIGWTGNNKVKRSVKIAPLGVVKSALLNKHILKTKQSGR